MVLPIPIEVFPKDLYISLLPFSNPWKVANPIVFVEVLIPILPPSKLIKNCEDFKEHSAVAFFPLPPIISTVGIVLKLCPGSVTTMLSITPVVFTFANNPPP